MARRLVTVDETTLRLPTAVENALKADLEAEFTTLADTATTAAATATADAAAAEAAAATATAPTDTMVADLIGTPTSDTALALDPFVDARIGTAVEDAVDGQLVYRFADTTDRDTAIPSPVAGQMALTGTGSTQVEWLYTGSAWIERWNANGGRPYRECAGTVAVSAVLNTAVAAAISFPAGRFTQTPLVLVTQAVSAPQLNSVSGSASSTTVGSVTVYRTSASATVNVAWHAIQMTPSSSAG